MCPCLSGFSLFLIQKQVLEVVLDTVQSITVFMIPQSCKITLWKLFRKYLITTWHVHKTMIKINTFSSQTAGFHWSLNSISSLIFNLKSEQRTDFSIWMLRGNAWKFTTSSGLTFKSSLYLKWLWMNNF